MKISIHVGKSVQTLELAKRMHRRAFRDSSSDIDHHDYMELVESLLEFIGKKATEQKSQTTADEWEESKHKRDPGGQFATTSAPYGPHEAKAGSRALKKHISGSDPDVDVEKIFHRPQEGWGNLEVSGKTIPTTGRSLQKVPLSKIIPTQQAVEHSGVHKYLSGGHRLHPPLIVRDPATGKHYLQDGHHRVAAHILSGRQSIMAEVVDVPMEGKKTKDDAPVGHPFYGNQYTEGLHTPKPKEAKSKVAKHAVHELLSSGHPFHIDELAEITGHQNKTSLASWISMFKNDKTAGPKGKLDIVKVGPHTYQVVKKADGQPAPAAPMPDPVPDLDLLNEKQPQQSAQIDPGSTPAAEPTSSPSPAPAVDPGAKDPKLESSHPENYGTQAAHYKHPPIVKPDAPMSKSEADKIYEAQQQHQIQTIQNLGKYLKNGGIDPATAPDQLYGHVTKAFKTAKSAAMAQWATNTKGVLFEPKPSEVFPADTQLMKDLAVSTTPEEAKAALAKWKQATHEAKLQKAAAAAQPPVAPPTPAPAAAPIPASTAPSFAVPDVLVPEGHQHVDTSDWEPASSGSSSKFTKGMLAAYNALNAVSTGSAQDNKKLVTQALNKRLAGSAHFQHLQKQYQQMHGLQGVHKGSLASRLVQQWAHSSGDHHAGSVAAQLAVRDVFKMDPDKVETKAFHYLQNNTEEETWHHAAQELGIKTDTPEALESFKAGMRDFALAQYHETQEFFKSKGMTHLYLTRGMRMGQPGEGSQPARKVKLKLQPASSFTVNHATAKSFSSGFSLFFVKVPVEQVMGSYMTGFGCTGEHEVVVLAHESLEAVQVGAGNAGSMSAMDSHVNTLKTKYGGIPGGATSPKAIAGSGAAHASGQTASPAPSASKKSYISSPTPPTLKIKVPPKPVGASGVYATQIKKALANGYLEVFEGIVEKVNMTAPLPTQLPKTKEFIQAAQKAIQEAKAEHIVKMEKWTAYHKKHKTGAI